MRVITAGESHGAALAAIVENVPEGIAIDRESVGELLRLRRGGKERSERQKYEKDEVVFLSGVHAGITTGAPVCIELKNNDYRAAFTEGRENIPLTAVRPGHADLAGMQKFGWKSAELVAERASARTTAVLVAAGAIALAYLKELGVTVGGYVDSIGRLKDDGSHTFEEILTAKEKPLYMLINGGSDEIERARERGDTLGGTARIAIRGMKSGFGSFTEFDRKIDGKLAGALMSLQGVKGVEFGEGFALSDKYGTDSADEIFYDREKEIYYRKTNRAGGIEGGMTNGEDITIRVAMKPIPTTARGVHTTDCVTKEETVSAKIRSDVSAVPSLLVIAECVSAIVLTEEISRRLGGDRMAEIGKRWNELPL